jgi:hypothetical protein
MKGGRQRIALIESLFNGATSFPQSGVIDGYADQLLWAIG